MRNPHRIRNTSGCIDVWNCERDGRKIVSIRVTAWGEIRVYPHDGGRGLKVGDREYAAAWLNDKLRDLSHDECYSILWE